MKLNSCYFAVIFRAALAILALAGLSVSAATHTWTGAGGNLWSAAGNWSGGAPTAGEAASVVLVFPPAGSKFTTNDITNLTVDQIQVTGDNYQIGAIGSGTNLAIRSQILGAAFFLSGSNTTFYGYQFNLLTNFTSTTWITIGTSDTATFRSRFTGNGGLQKLGNGTVRLQGGAPNTYLGDTFVIGGNLELNHTSNAIPGNLVIGSPSQTSTGTVTHIFQHQIADSANVTVWQNGVFDPSFFRETITSLSISNVDQGSGPSLTVLSNFTSYGQSSFSGILDLAGAYRTLNVMSGQLDVTGFIENSIGFAAFFKTGPGTLRLAQTNGFNTSVFAYEGKIIAAHNGALGNAAGTTIMDGAALEIAAGITIDEQLDIFGQGPSGQGALILRSNAICSDLVNVVTLPTTINVPDANAVATISGSVHGDGGPKKIGPGTLVLSGIFPNHFTGECTVEYGKLVLAKTGTATAIEAPVHIGVSNADYWQTASLVLSNQNQIRDNVNVFVDVTGLLNLNGYSEAIGSLELRRGYVTTGTGTLSLLGDVSVHTPHVDFDSDPAHSQISSNLSLGGLTRTFALEAGATLQVMGSILDGGASAGINVVGQNNSVMKAIYGPNTYTGPTTVESAQFYLVQGATPGTADGGTTFTGQGQLVLSKTSVGAESLTLNTVSNVAFGSFGTVWFSNTNSWSGPVNLVAESRLYGNGSDRLSLSGPITGPGAFRKQGIGTVELTGPEDNLLTGPVHVERGLLELNKNSGAVGITGTLNIGNATDAANSAIVRLRSANQIANSAAVNIEASGQLDLDSYGETVGPLAFGGGNVIGFGKLTLNDNVLCRGTNLVSQIFANTSLGGSTRTFRCETNCELYIPSVIYDGGGNAGVLKTGPGRLTFGSPNFYAGETAIAEGDLTLYTSSATPGNNVGQTIIHSNATLTLNNARVLDEPLTIYGNTNANYIHLVSGGTFGASNFWGGPVTLIDNAGIGGANGRSLALGGVISGDGLRFLGAGVDYLNGPAGNTYTGDTVVKGPTLILQKASGNAVPAKLAIQGGTSLVKLMGAEQIANDADVTAESAATLDLNGKTESIGSLGSASTTSLIINVTNTFTVGGNNQDTAFRGRISGGGGAGVTNLVKTGTGRLTLGNSHTYNGRTHVIGGTLELAGSLSNSPLYLYPGTRLTGNGTLASLTSAGGIIAPSGFGAGKLFGVMTSLGSVNLGNSSQFQVNLAGTNVPVDWDYLEMDQLQVLGGVLTIPSCSLVVTQNATGALSNQYTIVNVVVGGASMGTFTGYNEGANVISSSGQTFRIKYFAGSGNNDIILTQLSAAPDAPNFTGVVKLPGGIQLNGQGTANAQYQVLASTNVVSTNWINIGLTTANGSGGISFTDTNAANFSQRFYRLVSQ